MSTDYGGPHGTSTHGAEIDRPGDGEANGDRINDYAKLAGSKVHGMADQARKTVSRAAAAVQSTAGEARGYLQSAVGQARGKMTEYREHGVGRVQGDVAEYTRSRPLIVLGITAAIGVLLGWLSSTARRSR